VSLTVTATVTVTIAGTAGGGSFLGTGATYVQSLVNTAGVAQGSFSLALGFNPIIVPSTALGVFIVPPSGNSITLQIKGVTGDTGFPLAPASATYLPFSAAGAVATIGITAGAAVTVTLIWT
jgi:hypothetical protein